MEQKKPTRRQKISLILFVTWIICFYTLGTFLFGIIFPNDLVFIIYCIAIFIIFLIWGVLIAKGYKIEFLFLGKEFKTQWNFICHLQTIHPNYYVALNKKRAKALYRKRGNLYSSVTTEHLFTPLMLVSNMLPSNEDVYEHNQFWKDFLVYCLYFMTFNGGGIYYFFSFIVDFYDIEFDSLVKDIQSISEFPPKLKTLLSNTDCRMFFEYTRYYKLLDKEQINELEKLQFEYLNKADEFKDTLYSATSDIAFKNYKCVYTWYGLPQNTDALYINLHEGKRYCIIASKKRGGTFKKPKSSKRETMSINKEYKIYYEEFVPLTTSTEPLKTPYAWSTKEIIGIFETFDDAENSIKNKINGYMKISIIHKNLPE